MPAVIIMLRSREATRQGGQAGGKTFQIRHGLHGEHAFERRGDPLVSVRGAIEK